MTKILVIIGESSGDFHGGEVLKELKKIRPDIELLGTGGVKFQKISQKTYYKIEDLEVIGWWEVLKKWKYFQSIFQKMVSLLDSEKPDALFLVDYAGFNLRFAIQAKKKGIPVYFYIAPQVWAWKKSRVSIMKKTIQKMIVLFSFEIQFFAKENFAVECFGASFLDFVKKEKSKNEVFRKYKLKTDKKLVCLFAGSRKQELMNHLPKLLKTAEVLSKRKNLQFVCVLSSKNNFSFSQKIASSWAKKNVFFIFGDFYNLAGWADLAIASAGTVTLELAILETPTIIVYKTSFLSYFLAKYYFKIQKVGIPNIICKQNWLPELLQNNFTPKKLSQKAIEILDKKTSYQEMQKGFALLKKNLRVDNFDKNLGKQTAYQKTAKFLAKTLDF